MDGAVHRRGVFVRWCRGCSGHSCIPVGFLVLFIAVRSTPLLSEGEACAFGVGHGLSCDPAGTGTQRSYGLVKYLQTKNREPEARRDMFPPPPIRKLRYYSQLCGRRRELT